MSDIRDDLSAAIAENTPAEPVVETTTDTRPRDEQGRFAPKETTDVVAEQVNKDAAPSKAEEPTEKPPEEADPLADVETGRWTQDKAPSSWSPKVREMWGELPQEVRQEIIRREEAAVYGVRKLQDEIAPAKEFLRGMEPFIREARQYGVPPEQHIGAVMQTERVLRTGDLPTKFNALMSIADQYGIPLRQVINQSVGQEVIKTPPAMQQAQLPPEVMRELQEIRQWRESNERSSVQSEIQQFASDPKNEFFNDVRVLMANLIDSGVAANLQDAYDRAIWMEPSVREVMLGRQAQTAQRAQLTQKQAAAASVGSQPTSPGVDVTLNKDEDDSIAGLVRKAMQTQQTGRV